MAPPAEELPHRPGRFRRARRLVFYGSVRALAALVTALPRSTSAGMLAGLGWLAWWLRPADRRVALRQLALALPTWPAGQRRRLGRRALTVLGRNLRDGLCADVPVTIAPAAAHRLRTYLDGDKPVLFLSGHLGCWELLGPFLVEQGCELGVVTANPHNRRVDAWLRRRRRERGMTPFDRHEVRQVVRWLRRGHPLVVLGDHRSSGALVEAPWFGRPAPTPRGPGWLAQTTGALVVPLAVRRHGDGHEILLGNPVPTEDRTAPSLMARRCNEALEALILRAPEEWTWIHDRYGAARGD